MSTFIIVILIWALVIGGFVIVARSMQEFMGKQAYVIVGIPLALLMVNLYAYLTS